MASSAPSSPVIEATPLDSAPPMGGSLSAAAAAVTEPSAATAASSPSPVVTSTVSGRDEVALAKAAAEAAASATQAPTASEAAAEGASARLFFSRTTHTTALIKDYSCGVQF